MSKVSKLLPPAPELVVVVPQRSMDPEQAAEYVGGPELLRRYRKAGWVAPYTQGNRLTRYDLRDLDACIDKHKQQDPVPV